MEEFKIYEEQFKKLKKYNHYKKNSKRAGYNYVSEMVIKEYFDNKNSTRHIANLAGTKTLTWIHNFFKNNGFILRPTGVPIKMLSIQDDLETIDEKLNIRDYAEKKQIAESLGYDNVSKAIVDLYFNKHHTFKEIGRIFKCSETWALYFVKKLNMQSRSKGGANHQKMTEELKEKILKEMKNIEPTWENCRNYLELNNIKLSPKTIQRLIKCQKLQGLNLR